MFNGRSGGVHVLLPYNRQKQGASAVHDGDIWHPPIAIVGLQRLDHTDKEGMLRNCAHRIVADSRGHSASNPSWITKERVEASVAAVIQINIYTTVVSKDEVTDGISSLDGEGVVVESFEEPRVFASDELTRSFVGPQLLGQILAFRSAIGVTPLALHIHVCMCIWREEGKA